MDLELEGSVAIVTGGSRGLGLATARGLAAEGARLVVCARHREPLEAAAEEIREAGGDVEAVVCDVLDDDAPERLVGAALERWDRLDVLVNNVGGNRRGKFIETSDDDWRAVVDLNVLSHGRISRRALEEMGEGAAVLFVASVFGREAGGPGLSIYNTTKSALISMAKIMALELAPRGIRVNSIAPGSIRFPGGSWDRRMKEDPEGMAEFIAANIPMGRFGTAEEVADLATFLCSPRASWITGACVTVDGGQSRSLI